jgi:hypothetical protein
MILSSRGLVNKINKILNGYDDDFCIHETNAFSSLNLMEFAVNKLNNKEDFKLIFLVREKTLNLTDNNMQARYNTPTMSISVKQFNVRYFGYNNWLINEYE